MRILSSLILLLSGIAGGGSQAQPVPTEPPTVARPAARRLSVSWLSAAGGCIAHGGNAGATFTHDSALCHARYSGDPTPARDAFFRRFFHVFICLADTDTAAGSHSVAPSPWRT